MNFDMKFCLVFQKISDAYVPMKKVMVTKKVPCTGSSPSLYPFLEEMGIYDKARFIIAINVSNL